MQEFKVGDKVKLDMSKIDIEKEGNGFGRYFILNNQDKVLKVVKVQTDKYSVIEYPIEVEEPDEGKSLFFEPYELILVE